MTKAKSWLSVKEKKVVELYCLQGRSKTDAWREGLERKMPLSGDPEADAEKEVWWYKNKAAAFFAQPKVKKYVAEVLDTARAEDVMRVGRAVRQLEDFIDEAADAKNWTAVSQLVDKKLKVMGLMRDRVVISPEESLDDNSLVQQLSRGNPEVAKILAERLGRDSFDNVVPMKKK